MSIDTRTTEKRPGSVRRLAFSPIVVSDLIAITDIVIVIAAFLAVYAVYFGWNLEELPIYLVATAANVGLTIGGFYFSGLYGFDAITAPHRQAHKIFSICAVVFLLLVLIAFSLKISSEFSRILSFASFILEVLLIFSARLLYYRFIVKWARSGRFVRRIAIVGTGDQGNRLARELEKEEKKSPWLRVIGIYDDRKERSSPTIGAYSYRGSLEDLIRDSRVESIDDIIVALPWSAENRLFTILRTLAVLPAQILLSPDLIGHKYLHRDYKRIGNVSYLGISDNPISDWNYLIKGIEDRVLASIFLLVLLLPLGAIALAIKLDSPGPVLFRQKRYGLNNQLFNVLKFRSMVHDRPTDVGSAQAMQNDPRVTRLGRFLRRTSLDELPQLFNVLRGTMSLVGPRPLPTALVEEHAPNIEGYFARHRVKPGITGWAQVNGFRGETEISEKMVKRFEYDVYYVDNWSVFFDFKILIMTVSAVIKNENVY